MSIAAMRCGKCDNEKEGMLLPCGHVFCHQCVENVSGDHGRSYCLPCLDDSCTKKFAITQPPDPRCSPISPVQMPFVADRYVDEITWCRSIAKPKSGKKIMGMALIGFSIYVVSAEKGSISEYNVENIERLSGYPQNHPIPELKWARGLAASKRLGVLYITDWQHIFSGALLRYATNHAAQQTGVRKIDLDCQPFGVSVSEVEGSAVKIFVTCATPVTGRDQQIIEFVDDGSNPMERTRVLNLPSHFQIPRHSLLLTTGEFVVCHGWTRGHRHQVIKMSCQGNELNEAVAYGTFAGRELQQLRCPLSLCVDEDGLLLVVDYNNHRIQLLTQHLQLVRHLVTERDGIEDPRHVCLDSSRGLLYVGLQSGEIHVFDVRP